MKSNQLRIYVEGAMMIALATALSFIKLYDMPMGGSVTVEMVPLIVMGLRNGTKYGLLTGFIHGLIQMITGFYNVMYCETLLAQFGCIMLDYILAFSLLGIANVFAKMFKNRTLGCTIGTLSVGVIRFICSFLSGVLIWKKYTPEGYTPAYYSLVYNGAYMLPSIILCVIVVVIIAKTNPKILK